MDLKYLIFLLCLALQIEGFAQREFIKNYDTKIEVQTDRSVEITEFIEVYVGGNVIKRGITRSLPVRRSLNGRNVRMNYEIIEVVKNGEDEPYRSESQGRDLMLYLGERDVILDHGFYNYRIKYRATDQIAFFEDYDEIYWNAIGHESVLPVEQASVSIYLPSGAAIVQASAYTGTLGAKGKDFVVTEESGALIYKTTRPLNPREGLTIAVGIEKGIVKPPSIIDKYGTLIIVLLGFLTLMPYYIITWWRYGRDPQTPASYPDWQTPDDLSSASVSYVRKGRYDTKGFTASLIDLAIKGYLKIEETEKDGFLSNSKYYTLIKLKEVDSSDIIPQEEKALFEALFRNSSSISIEGTYDKDVERTYGNHKASLAAQYDDLISEGNNGRLLWLPVLITLAVGALSAFLLLRSAYAEGINAKILVVFAITGVVGFLLYIYLIRQPTIKKLGLRSRIKGFKMYLELVEEERLSVLHPPEMTPAYFESVLPYAFALGVEHKWSEKFKSILDQAQYRPQWHNSANHMYFSNHFGRDFSNSLSSAASPPPPKSSSGSGGGGFSGGGGGGGGVGGW
ncbi:MAG: putative membrane protein YgcG [Saprospiraceae bacterium]|jgi:uncharacterized membrane protein YgcG